VLTQKISSKSKPQSIRKYVHGGGFSYQALSSGDGILTFKVSSKDDTRPSQVFQNESGGHRWQRIPPTEKKGRVHTSTITVAVLDDSAVKSVDINPNDLDWKTTRGSGPGGQNRNKRENCVVLTHKPTGIVVRVDSKSQSSNKDRALKILTERLEKRLNEHGQHARNSNRRTQLGSGMRGDKVRTIRTRDNRVVDHKTGRKISLTRYLQGELP